jgi:hypothetical protein
MKTKLTLFRRNGIYYSQDSTTSKQKSLGTRDETAARQRGASSPHPESATGPRLLSASDPAFRLRTWQTAVAS